jgi:hypothetical protein
MYSEEELTKRAKAFRRRSKKANKKTQPRKTKA